MGTGSFEMDVAAPFRLDLTVWALRRRPHNSVDEWDGRTWRRTVAIEDRLIALRVAGSGTRTDPRLAVGFEHEGAAPGARLVGDLRRLITSVLGLDRDLVDFYRLAERDAGLAPLAERFVGMRPSRFPTVLEALVTAVACQQLSLDVGIHLLNRLAERLRTEGVPRGAPPCFPTAGQLAKMDVDELRGLGFSGAKSKTLVGLGHEVATGGVDLEALDGLDDRGANDALVELWGIGRWSAEYTLLRGLGRLEVLPGDDVGARNGLRRRFALPPDAGYDALSELARRWWPYGGLVYFHLLLDRLAGEGRLEPCPDDGPRRVHE